MTATLVQKLGTGLWQIRVHFCA